MSNNTYGKVTCVWMNGKFTFVVL